MVKKEELNIYSWADNFDEQVLRDFEKKYNVKINYDKYASNEEMLAKLQAGGAKYDLIQPSDYMVKTMAKMDLLAPLDKRISQISKTWFLISKHLRLIQRINIL